MNTFLAASIVCIVIGSSFLALSAYYYVRYLDVLEKESKLPPGSSSPYLHTDLDYSIYAGIGGALAIGGGTFLLVIQKKRLE